KYLRHHPEDYETEMRLANLFFAQKRYDDACKLYQALTNKKPRDPTLWFNFALATKEKGDLDGALGLFKRAADLSSPLPEGGLFQQGEIFRLKGNDDQSLVFYQQELNAHPTYLPALIALESTQRRKSLWKEARETRKKIADLKLKA